MSAMRPEVNGRMEEGEQPLLAGSVSTRPRQEADRRPRNCVAPLI